MSQSKNTKPVSYATSATYAADNNSKNDNVSSTKTNSVTYLSLAVILTSFQFNSQQLTFESSHVSCFSNTSVTKNCITFAQW